MHDWGQQALERTQADFVAIQKAKTPKSECADTEQAARNSVWKAAIGPCTITGADGKSAGVAICGRTHVGMKNSISNEAWPKLLNERFMLKHPIGSCYLTSCSAGVKDKRNLDTLQLMAEVLNRLKGPWAVGGD